MLIIGNGESRQQVNLQNLNSTKIGCNAIARDTYVEHLVCVDQRMVKECTSNHSQNYNKIYTRKDWCKNFNAECLPNIPYKGEQRWDEPFQWGSGPYAVLLGARLATSVSLIGFDLHSNTKTVNNVYKGTANYDDSSKRAVDPRYWIHQIGKVFECFPKVQFSIYQEPDWKLPKAWNYPNVMVDTISNIYYNT